MKYAKYLAALALCAGPAQAEFLDGNKLYERLISKNTAEYLNALGYITGVADTMFDINHCAPSNTTAGQLADMVKLYLEHNPSVRTKTGDVIVLHVLRTAWPCKRDGKT